jgi:AraC family ethanolamine operon transcriptional activator
VSVETRYRGAFLYGGADLPFGARARFASIELIDGRPHQRSFRRAIVEPKGRRMSDKSHAVPVGEASFEDFSEMEKAFQEASWSARYQQTSSGTFDGALQSSSLGPVQITRGHWGQGIRHTGLQPARRHALGFPLSPVSQGGRWLGTPIGPTDVLAQGSRRDFELLTPAGSDLVIFTSDEADLSNRIAALSQRDPEPLVERQGRFRLSRMTATRIRGALKGYFESLTASQSSPDRTAITQPMAEDLIELVLQVVVDACFEPLPTPALRRRVQLVRKAEELARSSESSVIRVSDLCEQLGVSERTLRYVFAELTGMSPAAYLRMQRLNDVRQALAQGHPEQFRVKTVAYEHGFWHLGQFASDYRKLFGERPSETLRAG